MNSINGSNDSHFAPDEAAMVAFGQLLAAASEPGLVVFLQGDLGMGKTTLARGFIGYFGHSGPVKSPTYTLVEPYEFSSFMLYHFDLYRLHDAEELEFMGIRDYFSENSVCLIEWAERGLGVLPQPDIVVEIMSEGSGRRLALAGESDRGRSVIARMQG
jgi:tRNA threonylcarbamoyladenosine biosynthesis protein TsaE